MVITNQDKDADGESKLIWQNRFSELGTVEAQRGKNQLKITPESRIERDDKPVEPRRLFPVTGNAYACMS